MGSLFFFWFGYSAGSFSAITNAAASSGVANPLQAAQIAAAGESLSLADQTSIWVKNGMTAQDANRMLTGAGLS